MSDDYRAYQAAAERIAAEAGALLLDAYGHVSAREKGPADLVTEADFASQRLIARRLDETFPGHTLLAEEEGAGAETDAADLANPRPAADEARAAAGIPVMQELSDRLAVRDRPQPGVVAVALQGGQLRGKVWIAEDFDAPDPEIEKLFFGDGTL